MNRFVPAHRCLRHHIQRSIALAVLGFAAGPVYAADNDRMKIGAGAAVVPRFQGSDEYRVRSVPLIDFQKGRLFARTGDGIGLNIIQTPRFTVGGGVNWMTGYRSKDVPDG